MFAFEQKCQAKGQKLKLDNIKEWKIVSLLSLDKKQPTAIAWNLSGLACRQLKLNHSIKIEFSFSKTLIKVL